MPTIVLAEAVEAGNDLVYVVTFTKKPASAVLYYTVTGPWETGLLKIIVNGKTVKDYSGWWGLWPFTGSDSVDITQHIVVGENKIIFEPKVQIIPIIGIVIGKPSITAYLVTDVQASAGGGEQPSDVGKFMENMMIFLILIVGVVLVVSLVRR